MGKVYFDILFSFCAKFVALKGFSSVKSSDIVCDDSEDFNRFHFYRGSSFFLVNTKQSGKT